MVRKAAGRPAFTLVELLVAMAVVIVLASLALLVVPDILDKDRTTDAASLTRQYLMIAKSRAARDKGNRGVRLIVNPTLDPQNPAKTSQFWVTEVQYTEQPPPYQPNPVGSQFISTGPTFNPLADNAPYVVFLYRLTPASAPTPPGPAVLDPTFNPFAPGSPVCEIRNLSAGDAALIDAAMAQNNLVLNLPALGYEARVKRVDAGQITTPPTPAPPAMNSVGPNTFIRTVTLDKYPSDTLGASGVPGQTVGVYVDYQFGIVLPPRPLLGEPPLQMPKNICIDLTPRNPTGAPQPVPFNEAPSQPAGMVGQDYDIVFTPRGHVAPYGAGAQGGQLFLWVRDYTKTASPLVVQNTGTPPTFDLAPFRAGGEQQIIVLKTSSGSMGVFPALWPNGNGQYNQISPGVFEDAYTPARNGSGQ